MAILFVGGGNMASALVGGMLQHGFSASELAVVDISADARGRMQSAFGVSASAELPREMSPQVVVLAVKPQQMRAVAQQLRPMLGDALVISIAAGIRCTDLSRWLGGHRRIARVMPNMPALIGAGVSGMYAMSALSASDRDMAARIVSAVGATVWVDSEALLEVVTAVSGSGPAYVFYFMEALEAAARALGLDAAAARKLTMATFAGAARLAAQSEETASTLRARVTSRGGTTERALAVLEAAGVREHIHAAVTAAARRAHELGEEFGKD